ncbi:hypothetical protein ACIGW3_17815 [Streptomyces sp. NPDC053499]|uniref:hypothetical protein n=1 Tax=Streptomyces sp. NPDC053499 TaxID=3365707 RepID=UPI0037D37315
MATRPSRNILLSDALQLCTQLAEAGWESAGIAIDALGAGSDMIPVSEAEANYLAGIYEAKLQGLEDVAGQTLDSDRFFRSLKGVGRRQVSFFVVQTSGWECLVVIESDLRAPLAVLAWKRKKNVLTVHTGDFEIAVKKYDERARLGFSRSLRNSRPADSAIAPSRVSIRWLTEVRRTGAEGVIESLLVGGSYIPGEPGPLEFEVPCQQPEEHERLSSAGCLSLFDQTRLAVGLSPSSAHEAMEALLREPPRVPSGLVRVDSFASVPSTPSPTSISRAVDCWGVVITAVHDGALIDEQLRQLMRSWVG